MNSPIVSHLFKRAISFHTSPQQFLKVHLSKRCSRKLSTVPLKRSVYISQSNDIFENLAFEDWLYHNYDFEAQSLLFLWVNKPCVVIGRHQNPWIEVNQQNMIDSSVQLARRNSGGGTVYHDFGNLNFSFFTARTRYNRKQNLEFICDVLKENWKLDVTLSAREDIILDSAYKISGTASKLGHKTAYHHCTLLIDVDSSQLFKMLDAQNLGIESKATASTRSQTRNIASSCPLVTVDKVIEAVGYQYLAGSSTEFGISYVDPKEIHFHGLNGIIDSFSSWKWIYGKTPRFTVRLPTGDPEQIVQLEVHHGVIETLDFSRSDVAKADIKIWTEFLANRQLDRQLRHTLSTGMVSFLGGEANTKLKNLLIALCPVNL